MDHPFAVLRDQSGKALGVSYTEQGLKYVTATDGSLPYYRKAFLSTRIDEFGDTEIYIRGDTRKSTRVKVEKFVPTDQRSGKLMRAEIQAADKALRMLYVQKRHEPAGSAY